MTAAAPRYDVVVLGAGSAGIAAAITAAREGAKTLLMERHGSAGGMATAALVHSFCGLYLLRDEPGAVLANPGICAEIEGRMIVRTGLGPQRHGRVDVLPQHPVEFARMADEMMAAEGNLEVFFHSEVIAVSGGAGDWRIDLAQRGGRNVVVSKTMVDASGDAVVAGLLNAESAMASPDLLQRPALIFGVCRPGKTAADDRLLTSGWLVKGVRAGRLPEAVLGLAFRASGRECEYFGTLDLAGGDVYSPLDAEVLTSLEMTGREIAMRAVAWLAEHAPGWRGAYVSQWPARAGVRESRRWLGEAVLTGDDLLHGRRFADEIALATWPVELRETAKGARLRFPFENRAAGIPLSCLRPKGRTGLWVAGRCISTDHTAQASIRVMGTCFATGEAAGRAAAREATGLGWLRDTVVKQRRETGQEK